MTSNRQKAPGRIFFLRSRRSRASQEGLRRSSTLRFEHLGGRGAIRPIVIKPPRRFSNVLGF
jgi:hypothetical protein